MRGGRRGFVVFNTLLVVIYLGCGDRDTGAVPAADSLPAADPAAAAPPGTASTASDTIAAGTDTAPKAAVSSAPATPPAAAKPAAPAPRPATARPPAPRPAAAPAPADTADIAPPAHASDAPPAQGTDTPPAQASDTAPASAPQTATAPLRDEYHRAPLDTVSQQVYDGWKQYNLNCARCHGEDVLGSTIAPHLVASLRPNGPINTKELFVQTVCAGRPEKGMPAWCPLGLEMDKIEAMYAYVKGRSEGKIRPGRPAVNPEG